MTNKPQPRGRRKRIFEPAAPEVARQQLVKDRKESKPHSNPKVVQAVVNVVTEEPLVHFYLACGHLLTIAKRDLKGAQPKEMECWACARKKKETS